MIYVCYYWGNSRTQTGDDLRIGMVTADKAKAEAFVARYPGFQINEIEDGDEWPTF